MQRIGIVAKRGNAEAASAQAQLAEWLRARKKEVLVEDRGEAIAPPALAVPGEKLGREVDLIVVLGGDGTLIHAASLCAGREVPIVGVNLGTLGFLTEVRLPDAHRLLEAVFAGEYAVERRMKLAVRALRGSQVLMQAEVLNDAVINKGALARMMSLDCRVGGRLVTTYTGDGVIVSTPTGSTAYSLSAQGPILHPAMNAIVLNPICPHTLTQRPLVLPDDAAIELELSSEASEVWLTLDGQTGRPLEKGDRVQLDRARSAALLVKNPLLDYFSVLREKLRWGAR